MSINIYFYIIFKNGIINYGDFMKKDNKQIEEKAVEKKVEGETTSTPKETSKLLKVIKDLIPYIIILIVVILIRTYLITPIMVSGPSMNCFTWRKNLM